MKMMDDSRAIPNNSQTMIDPQELSKAALYNIFDNSQFKIIDRLQENNQTKLHLDGLLGSAVSFVIRAIQSRRSVLIILNNKEEAAIT
jgi:transcription-repair coupling factor (superfamily II helicase)